MNIDISNLGVEADPYLASRSSLPTSLPPVGTSAMNASNSEIPKKMSIPIAKYSSWRVFMNIPTKITKGITRINSINGGRI